MYTNVFLICDGKLVFDVIGFLEEMKRDVDRTVIWTGGNVGALVLFLKCLGFTFPQMASRIEEFEFIEDFVHGGNLEMTAKTYMLQYATQWIDSIFEDKKLFKPDITLKEVYKMTNIFPNFITFKNKITRLNPVETPDLKLRDCVLASLTNYGVFPSYNGYSSFSDINPFPKEMNYTVLENPKTLYIANYSEIEDSKPGTYTQRIEMDITNIYFKRLYHIVKNDLDIALVNGLWESKVSSYSIEKSMENGAAHARMFTNGDDTTEYMKILLSGVKNQS